MNVDTFLAGTSALESAAERASVCAARGAFHAAGGAPDESPARAISPALQGDDTNSLIEFLSRRYSMGPKYLARPGPSARESLQATQLALRAPDHRRLRPVRFVRVCDHQRERLGKLFAADAARRGHGLVEIERAREAFCAAGETLVAWVVAGTPTQAGRARHDDNASDVLSEWS